jgi:hypothetical protein
MRTPRNPGIMPAMAPSPRDGAPRRRLFIVARDEPDLFDYIKRDLYDDATAEVIIDRRIRERRQRRQPPATDRRHSDRRKVVVSPALKAFGYAVIDL